MEKAANVIATVWIATLMIITFVSLAYATYQLCTGNVHGTASFEF